MHTPPTPPPAASPSTGRSGFLPAVARRWPTVLGLAAGIDSFLGEVTDQGTRSIGGTLLLLPLIYVIMATVRRRRWTWPIVIAGAALLVALRIEGSVDPTVVILAVALAATLWGVGHGRHRERDFRLQVAAMAGFTVLIVTALAVDPDVARYLVAAGWLAHGVWDWVHLARDRVVSRSFAEWCAALDVMIAASLIIVPLL